MYMITSLFLLAFSTLNLGGESKNPTVKNIYRYLQKRRDMIGYWGFIYGIIVSVLSLFFIFGTFFMGVMLVATMLLANLLLVFLATPYAYPSIKKHIKNKNSRIHKEMQRIIKLNDDYSVIMSGFAGIIAVFGILTVIVR